MYFAQCTDFVEHNNRVIVANRQTGTWLKIPAQCYEIITKSIKLAYTEKDMLDHLADDEDRAYMAGLIRKLWDMGVIEDERKVKDSGHFSDFMILITHRCNLACKHCSVSAGTAADCEKIGTQQLKQLFDKVFECQPRHITLSGGEPLIRTDFLELLDYLKANYTGDISLMTNGTLISDENIDKICETFTSIDISLDGVDEDSCARIRGKGVYQKVINAIKLLQCNGFDKISLSMVSTPQNALLEDEFLSLCDELHVKPILRKYDLLGRAISHEEELAKVDSVYKEKKRRVITPPPIEEEIVCTCQGGMDSLYINSDGDVYPCAMLEKEGMLFFNALEKPSIYTYFHDINIAADQTFCGLRKIDPSKADGCKDCPVNIFCWSCPYYLLMAQNDELIMSQHCLPQKLYLMERIWGEKIECNSMGDERMHNGV